MQAIPQINIPHTTKEFLFFGSLLVIILIFALVQTVVGGVIAWSLENHKCINTT
jgi:hypothetical protein